LWCGWLFVGPLEDVVGVASYILWFPVKSDRCQQFFWRVVEKTILVWFVVLLILLRDKDILILSTDYLGFMLS